MRLGSSPGLFRSGGRDPEGEDIDLLAESDLYRSPVASELLTTFIMRQDFGNPPQRKSR